MKRDLIAHKAKLSIPAARPIGVSFSRQHAVRRNPPLTITYPEGVS